MKIEIEAEEIDRMAKSVYRMIYRMIDSVKSVPEKEVSESEYKSIVSKKWGSLPADMELDSEGNPQVKTNPVDTNFKGIVK